MKIQTIANPLISSENMQSSVMGMDARGADMATYYLRDKIYSDKILAVVREYVCNALDEHAKHNIDKPVDFGIRNSGENKEFFVRDYANGLSEDDIRNIFGMYFRSTKSHDNSQVGGFGIGSKAFHCYTDTFYVKSFHSGVCSTYACALGGGNSGVPVGHILKVGENPTNESGLEVFAEIKNTDLYSFNATSQRFVEFCDKKIVYHYFEQAFLPQESTGEISKNGFKFRFFAAIPSCNKIYFAMGSVIYGDAFFTYPNAQLLGKAMVVDIPIGKMTLPISRESFENTPQNNKIKETIATTINEIIEEDLASIPKMTVLELLADLNNVNACGKFFSTPKKILYKSVYPFIQTFRVTGDPVKDFEKRNGKIVCAVARSSKANYWFDKLDDHAIKNGKKYYLTYQSVLDECDFEKLSETFEFRTVKSKIFNWPVSESGKKELSMSDARIVNIKDGYGYYSKRSMTPLQVYNRLASDWHLDSTESLEEVKENLSEMEFDSVKKLNSFSVARSTSTSGLSVTVTASKAMHTNLVSLGFLDADSQVYKDKRSKILKKEQEITERTNIINSASKRFMTDDFANEILKKSQNNLKFAKKVNLVFKNIMAEDSIRAKLLKSAETCHDHWNDIRPKFSRNELRKILLLK